MTRPPPLLLGRLGRFQQALAVCLSLILVLTTGHLAEATASLVTVGPQSFRPPANLGQLTDYFSPSPQSSPIKGEEENKFLSPGGRGQGEGAPLVVLIQDLHISYGVQKKIAAMLAHWDKKGLLPPVVAVEGAEGPIDASILANYPDREIRRAVGDYFVRKGELTGPGLYAVESGKAHLLYGVEKGEYYDLHRKLFQDTFGERSQLAQAIEKLEGPIQALKKREDTPKNLVQVERDLYLLKRLLKQQVTEDEVRQVARNLPRFLHTLQILLGAPGSGPAYRTGRLRQGQVAGRALSPEPRAVEDALKSAIDFYVMAIVREKPMAKHTLALLTPSPYSSPPRRGRGEGEGVVVLVAGGFHTAGLTAHFRSQGIAYAVITPKVDEINPGDEKLYADRLLGKHVTIEEILSDRIFPVPFGSVDTLNIVNWALGRNAKPKVDAALARAERQKQAHDYAQFKKRRSLAGRLEALGRRVLDLAHALYRRCLPFRIAWHALQTTDGQTWLHYPTIGKRWAPRLLMSAKVDRPRGEGLSDATSRASAPPDSEPPAAQLKTDEELLATAFEQHRQPISWTELFAQARVALVGDLHPSTAEEEELRDHMEEIRQAGATLIALESLDSDTQTQEVIDAYDVRSGHGREPLLACLQAFYPSPIADAYLEVIDAAKRAGLRVIGLNMPYVKQQELKRQGKSQSEVITLGDQHMASVIIEHLSVPTDKMIVLVGTGHVLTNEVLIQQLRNAGLETLSLASTARPDGIFGLARALLPETLQAERFLLPREHFPFDLPFDGVINVSGTDHTDALFPQKANLTNIATSLRRGETSFTDIFRFLKPEEQTLSAEQAVEIVVQLAAQEGGSVQVTKVRLKEDKGWRLKCIVLDQPDGRVLRVELQDQLLEPVLPTTAVNKWLHSIEETTLTVDELRSFIRQAHRVILVQPPSLKLATPSEKLPTNSETTPNADENPHDTVTAHFSLAAKAPAPSAAARMGVVSNTAAEGYRNNIRAKPDDMTVVVIPLLSGKASPPTTHTAGQQFFEKLASLLVMEGDPFSPILRFAQEQLSQMRAAQQQEPGACATGALLDEATGHTQIFRHQTLVVTWLLFGQWLAERSETGPPSTVQELRQAFARIAQTVDNDAAFHELTERKIRQTPIPALATYVAQYAQAHELEELEAFRRIAHALSQIADDLEREERFRDADDMDLPEDLVQTVFQALRADSDVAAVLEARQRGDLEAEWKLLGQALQIDVLMPNTTEGQDLAAASLMMISTSRSKAKEAFVTQFRDIKKPGTHFDNLDKQYALWQTVSTSLQRASQPPRAQPLPVDFQGIQTSFQPASRDRINTYADAIRSLPAERVLLQIGQRREPQLYGDLLLLTLTSQDARTQAQVLQALDALLEPLQDPKARRQLAEASRTWLPDPDPSRSLIVIHPSFDAPERRDRKERLKRVIDVINRTAHGTPFASELMRGVVVVVAYDENPDRPSPHLVTGPHIEQFLYPSPIGGPTDARVIVIPHPRHLRSPLVVVILGPYAYRTDSDAALLVALSHHLLGTGPELVEMVRPALETHPPAFDLPVNYQQRTEVHARTVNPSSAVGAPKSLIINESA